jgi:hypothetical protein
MHSAGQKQGALWRALWAERPFKLRLCIQMLLCKGLVAIALLSALVCTQNAFGDGQDVDLDTLRQRLACQQRHLMNESAVISNGIQPSLTCYGTAYDGNLSDIFPSGDEDDDRMQKATQQAKEAWKTIQRHVLVQQNYCITSTDFH